MIEINTEQGIQLLVTGALEFLSRTIGWFWPVIVAMAVAAVLLAILLSWRRLP